MHYTDIDLNRTSSEGAKLLREYLHYAENGDAVLERTVFTNSFEQEEFDFELEICEFLRSNGFVIMCWRLNVMEIRIVHLGTRGTVTDCGGKFLSEWGGTSIVFGRWIGSQIRLRSSVGFWR